jgi:hypothetical protein
MAAASGAFTLSATTAPSTTTEAAMHRWLARNGGIGAVLQALVKQKGGRCSQSPCARARFRQIPVHGSNRNHSRRRVVRSVLRRPWGRALLLACRSGLIRASGGAARGRRRGCAHHLRLADHRRACRQVRSQYAIPRRARCGLRPCSTANKIVNLSAASALRKSATD